MSFDSSSFCRFILDEGRLSGQTSSGTTGGKGPLSGCDSDSEE